MSERSDAREAAHQAVKAFDRDPSAGNTQDAIAALQDYQDLL